MLEGNQINVDGFEIPSDNPVFLTILSIHILAALTCLVSGIIAMLSKKQHGIHPKAGKIYYWGLSVVFVTASFIAILRWKEDYHLFILGSVAFFFAFIGRKAKRNNWKKWSIIHISCMGLSYIFMLIAFYVDNGKFLPVWKNFNPVIYWLLPLIIGIPIIIRVLLTHPLSRNYFRKKL